MGHITRDPELKYTPNGQAVASFGIATNRRWSTPEGEKREEVEFHNIVAWGRSGEVIHQYLKKGSPIFVEGRLKTQNWEGSDGVKRSRTEVIVESFQFIGTGNQGGGGASQSYNQNQNSGFNNDQSTANPAGNMSSPTQNAQFNNPPVSPDNNNPPPSSQANPPAANPFDNDKQENKPDIGNPEDISIDDIPF